MKRLVNIFLIICVSALTAFIVQNPSAAKTRFATLAAAIKQLADSKFRKQPPAAAPESAIPESTPQPVAAATPEPAPAESQAVAAEAPPQPIAAPTLEETPDKVLTELTTAKNEWPQTVICKEPIEFPATMNGRIIGSVKVPPGTPLKLLSVQMYQITVGYLTTKQVIPVSKSNLVAQVIARRHGGQPIH